MPLRVTPAPWSLVNYRLAALLKRVRCVVIAQCINWRRSELGRAQSRWSKAGG